MTSPETPSPSISDSDFRALLEAAPDCYLILRADPDYTIVGVSDAYLRATMTRRQDIVGRPLFVVFPDNPGDPTADGKSNLRASLQIVLREKRAHAMGVQKYDIRRPASEGGGFEERHWSPLNCPVLDARGEVSHIIHRAEDVTELLLLKRRGEEQHRLGEELRASTERMQSELIARSKELGEANRRLEGEAAELKRAREEIGLKNVELAEKEAFARSVTDAASDAILTTDEAGTILSWNKGAEGVFGHTPAEAIGRPLARLLPERHRDLRLPAPAEAHRMAKTLLLEGRRRDGTEFPAELRADAWLSRGRRFFTVVLRDVTERSLAEAQLRESEERFRLIVQRVTDYAIFMLDPEGRIATWNAGAERIKGYEASEILGKHFSIFYDPESVKSGHPARELEIATAEGHFEEEGWRVRKDGSRFWASVVLTALRDAKGALRGFSKVTRDFTERKRREDEIRKLNEELEAFSYSVSHDLRAPLRHVHGYARILLEDHAAALDGEGRRLLDEVTRGAQKMGRLIDDLLEFSKVGRTGLRGEPLPMEELARSVLRECLEACPAREIQVDVGPLPEGHGDRALVRQVLLNLVNNAIKYTGTRPKAVVELGGRRTDRESTYWVRDNGVGFDMKYVHKLFGVFQRLHGSGEFEGTGVGLALVKRIIDRHGGRVWAEGEAGRGAAFYFTLPHRGG